jgi:hypothetical protein
METWALGTWSLRFWNPVSWRVRGWCQAVTESGFHRDTFVLDTQPSFLRLLGP